MSLLRNSACYAAVGVLEKLLPFALLPIYTRYLTASDLGVVATVMGVVKFLVLFYALGGSASVLRHAFPEKGRQLEPGRVWGTLVIFVVCIGGVSTLLLALSSEWILSALAKDVPFWPIMALGLAIAFFSPIRRYFLTSLQARELGWSYTLHAGGALLLRLPVVLICLQFLGWKVEAVLFSILASEVMFAILGLVGFHHVVRWKLDSKILRSSLSYSLPLLPHALAGWVATYLGAMVLNFSVGAAEAGIYNLANQFNVGIALIGMAYIRALTPLVFRALSSGERAELESAGRKVIVGVCGLGVVCLFFALFSEEIAYFLLGMDFTVVGGYIPFFTISAFLYVLHSFHISVLLYDKRGTWWLLASSICAMVLTVGLMFWLIPAHGIIGAAVAAASGVVLRLLLLLVLCNTRFETFWPQAWFWGLAAVVVVGSVSPLIGISGLGVRTAIFVATATACAISAKHFMGRWVMPIALPGK